MFGNQSQFNQRQTRLFKKGDLKYIILDIVKDNPSHVYDITAVLTERFHGFYSPSAGSIYPILQLLEKMEYVSSCRKEEKNIYTITDAGKRFLQDEKATTDKIKERFKGVWRSSDKQYLRDVRAVLNYSSEIRHLVGKAAISKDPGKLQQIKDILLMTLTEIIKIDEES